VNLRDARFSTHKIKGQIRTGKQPQGVSFSPGGEIVALPNEGDNMLSVIGRCK
jgi:DNA-binding beta-propeller fold protein YncE